METILILSMSTRVTAKQKIKCLEAHNISKRNSKPNRL